MTSTELIDTTKSEVPNSTSCLRTPTVLITALLFAVAGILGGAGWSGKPALNYFALLYPFVYLHSRRRLDCLSAAFYYASATWSVIPGSQSFFRTGASLLLPLLIWIALITLSTAPWLLFYNRRHLPLAAVAAIVTLAFPPLSLITVTHPLIAVGHWFPGTRWFGLCLPVVLIAGYRRFGTAITATILVAASLATHARYQAPGPEPHIIAVDTRFGGPAEGDPFGSSLEGRERLIQRIALEHPDSLLLLPESIIPIWTPMHEARWATTFAELQARHTGLLIGTTIPIPNTEANRNILLSRGYSERLSYVQRVPIPLGMWHIGDDHDGFPLMLHFPPSIRIWNQRAGVLMCYEQLLMWPALQTLSRNPTLLLAPSNLYWASGTIIPSIQHISAKDWADLWAIPLYEASNQ
jgi:hypothetical protein